MPVGEAAGTSVAPRAAARTGGAPATRRKRRPDEQPAASPIYLGACAANAPRRELLVDRESWGSLP